MTSRQVRLGRITIHPQVVEKMGATRLGCELEAFALGIRATQIDPRRKVLFNALGNYAEAVSAISIPDKTEVWFATSLDRTEVFIPKPIRGKAVRLIETKLCCNPTAARLLTPAQVTSIAMRHRNGDWGVATKDVRASNDHALQQGGDVISVFRFSHPVEAYVTSVPHLIWVAIEAKSIA